MLGGSRGDALPSREAFPFLDFARQLGTITTGFAGTFRVLARYVIVAARALLLVLPSGLEGFFHSLGRPAEAMALPPEGRPPSPEQIAQMEGALAEYGVTFVYEG